MDFDFTGKTVLVTGGARGIGGQISRLFASKGARVLVNHLATPEDMQAVDSMLAEESFQGRLLPVAGDICAESTAELLAETVRSSTGTVDVFINSAGYTTPATLESTDRPLWHQLVDINLSGAFYMAKAVVPYMRSQGWGRLIFIGSAGSITGGGGSVGYSAAKAGINGLVRSLSKELAPLGITVNAILPAIIDTDLLRTREPDPERRRMYVDRIPVGRLGTPADVAWLAMFLASGYAGYISGQQIIIDGGSTYR